MSKRAKSQGNQPPKAPAVRCAGCRQKVVQAIQQGQLLPETAYSQIQRVTPDGGWEETPETVRALVKHREETPFG